MALGGERLEGGVALHLLVLRAWGGAKSAPGSPALPPLPFAPVPVGGTLLVVLDLVLQDDAVGLFRLLPQQRDASAPLAPG